MSESKEDKPLAAARGTWGSVLAAPRLFPARLSQPSTNTSVLRPPQLKAGSNPFVRVATRGEESYNSLGVSSLAPEEKNSVTRTEDSKEDKKHEETTVPKFLPLHNSRDGVSFAGGTVPETASDGLTRTSTFVFGQNLQDRVVKQTNSDGDSPSSNNEDHPPTNGTSDLLFSSAVQAKSDISQNSKPKNDFESSEVSSASTPWGGISETPPLPVIPPSGPLITGEEGETNVYQVNCRLFAFEGGQWKERCRGQLRLNDSDTGSRLVCRAAGSLRVLLNTKVWGEMTVEHAGAKSLRVTATDSHQQVKVFLVMASPDEIGQLHKCLSVRVASAKQKEESLSGCKETSSQSARDTSAEAEPAEARAAVVSPNNGNTDAEVQTAQENSTHLGNPVVIVSGEDEDTSSQPTVLKRPLDVEEQHEQSKKVCTESISDVPQL